MSWLSRIANALRPGRTTGSLDEEFQSHLDERIDELVRSGVPREEAGRQARRQFGNRLRLRESSHEVKSAVWLETLLADFRFGGRMIAKHRTASAAAVVSLAIAIGACTAAFTLIDALVFRPLPVANPREIIDLARMMPGFLNPGNQPRPSASFSYPLYQLLRDTSREQADLFAMSPSTGFQPASFAIPTIWYCFRPSVTHRPSAAGAGAKTSFPKWVAEDRNSAAGARHIVIGLDQSSESGLHSEDAEAPARNRICANIFAGSSCIARPSAACCPDISPIAGYPSPRRQTPEPWWIPTAD